ncbi:MAG: hypothetical protein RL632_1437 [Bacteroidota bacterium]
MEKSLDSMHAVLKENRLDTLAGIRIAANAILTRLKTYYDVDTLDMNLGMKMSKFRAIRKAIDPEEDEEGEEGGEREEEHEHENEGIAHRTIGSGFSIVRRGLDAESLALSTLRKDIENGNGRRDKYAEYIKFEQQKVYQLQQLLKAYVDHKNKTIKDFNEIYAELNAFSLKLMEKK